MPDHPTVRRLVAYGGTVLLLGALWPTETNILWILAGYASMGGQSSSLADWPCRDTHRWPPYMVLGIPFASSRIVCRLAPAGLRRDPGLEVQGGPWEAQNHEK